MSKKKSKSDSPWLRGWKRRHHQPVFWSKKKIQNHLKRLFRGRWIPDRTYHHAAILGDREYYLPHPEEARTIIRNSHLDTQDYARFRFDCEDFAYVLKAHFCQAAYRKKRRQYAYCFGIIWGEELWTGQAATAHAMNWMITCEGEFRLIEPQTGKTRELKPLSQGDRRVYLLIA